MRPPRTPLEETVRLCLVIGAILLLVANLLPHGGGKSAILVIGGVLVIVGILGELLVLVLPGPHPQSGGGNSNHSSKRSRRRR